MNNSMFPYFTRICELGMQYYHIWITCYWFLQIVHHLISFYFQIINVLNGKPTMISSLEYNNDRNAIYNQNIQT